MSVLRASFQQEAAKPRTKREPVVAPFLGAAAGKLVVLLRLLLPFVMPAAAGVAFCIGGFLAAPVIGFFVLGLVIIALWVLVERSY